MRNRIKSIKDQLLCDISLREQTTMTRRNHIMNINSNDYAKSQYEYHTAWV